MRKTGSYLPGVVGKPIPAAVAAALAAAHLGGDVERVGESGREWERESREEECGKGGKRWKE
jgi:hypothetical protein